MNEATETAPGLLYTITGDGKGKSTSAFGMALRTLGWGGRVTVLQFVKSDRETGEKRFFRDLCCERLRFEQCGCGLSWMPGDHAGMAATGWERAKLFLRGATPEYMVDLLVLDELNVAIQLGWLDIHAVTEALRCRRRELNVVVTGRDAKPEMMAISDMVSEIIHVKHPFECGIAARKGLDY